MCRFFFTGATVNFEPFFCTKATAFIFHSPFLTYSFFITYILHHTIPPQHAVYHIHNTINQRNHQQSTIINKNKTKHHQHQFKQPPLTHLIQEEMLNGPKRAKCNIRVQAKKQRRRVKPLRFVTGNKNKLLETGAILSNTIPKLVRIDLDLPELQAACTEEISKEKCKIASQKAGKGVPVIVEDTSLCFNALNGLPGPYIKWFLQGVGHDGLNKMLAGFEDKSAYALCVFSYCDDPEKEPMTFVGKCPGKIVPARGPPNSFGWDPIFQPDGFDITFAEMDKATKNTISHRLRALDQFKTWINENPQVLLEDYILPDGEVDEEWDYVEDEAV